MVLAILSTLVLVAVVLIIHYDAMRLISLWMKRFHSLAPRPRMLLAMGGIFVAHMAEIVVFAVGYLVLHRYERFGDFAGEAAKPENFGEYLYFSTITYTSLGFGDVYPTGGLRMVAGIESLIGLLLIAWSASFTYLLMVDLWPLHGGKRRH